MRAATLVVIATGLFVLGCETVDDEPEAVDESGAAEVEPDARQAPDEPPQAAQEPEPADDEPPERAAWIGVEDDNELVRVDLDEHEVTDRHQMPAGPHNVTVAGDGTVAGALYEGASLALLDEGEVELVELGVSPHDVKAFDDGFVVANEFAERLDLVGHDGVHLGQIPIEGEPHDVAVAPDGTTAWVTINGTDRLAIVDLEEQAVVEDVSTGASPHNILFEPDGDVVWITDWTGPVHALSRDGELLATLPVGDEAHHLAFTPHGDQVWVTDHATHEVIVIDTADREVLERLMMRGSPHHVHITPDGELAAVTDHTNGEVVIFDVATHQQITTVDVGLGPHGVWTVPFDR